MTSAVAPRTCSVLPMTGCEYGESLGHSSGRIVLYSRSHGRSSLPASSWMTAPFSCWNSCLGSMRMFRIRSASMASALVHRSAAKSKW